MGYNYFLNDNTLMMKHSAINDMLHQFNIKNVYDAYSIRKALFNAHPEFEFDIEIGNNGVENVRATSFNQNTIKNYFKETSAGSETAKWKVL